MINDTLRCFLVYAFDGLSAESKRLDAFNDVIRVLQCRSPEGGKVSIRINH